MGSVVELRIRSRDKEGRLIADVVVGGMTASSARSDKMKRAVAGRSSQRPTAGKFPTPSRIDM